MTKGQKFAAEFIEKPNVKSADEFLSASFPKAKTADAKTEILRRYFRFHVVSGTGHKKDSAYYGLIIGHILSENRDWGARRIVREKYHTH